MFVFLSGASENTSPVLDKIYTTIEPALPILIPLLIVAGIGIVLGIVLVVASHFFKVEEDETYLKVRECLPGANCGACGYAGCDSYAEAVAAGKAEANLCIPGGADVVGQLSEILGVELTAAEEQVAFVRCNGDCDTVKNMDVIYDGVDGCRAQQLVYGGPSACKFGCMGCGDCANACPVNAICVHDSLAHINPDICIACGKCAKVCPNKVIEMVPKKAKVVVMCNNPEKGAVAKKQCKNVCFGCKKCERVCPEKAIKVENNLASIDFAKCTGCRECFNSCITNCIKAVDFYEGTIG